MIMYPDGTHPARDGIGAATCDTCGVEFETYGRFELGGFFPDNDTCEECMGARQERLAQRREMRERLFKLCYDPIHELADGDERLQNELVFLVNAFGLGRENSALEILRNDCHEFVASWLEQARRNVTETDERRDQDAVRMVAGEEAILT